MLTTKSLYDIIPLEVIQTRLRSLNSALREIQFQES